MVVMAMLGCVQPNLRGFDVSKLLAKRNLSVGTDDLDRGGAMACMVFSLVHC